MCMGGGGKSKRRQMWEMIAEKAQADEAKRKANAPVMQSPENIKEDKTFRSKGRRGLRIALDESSASGTGLAISAG